MPVAHAERLAAILPNSRIELVADSYTLVPLDQPTVLGDLIGDFVTGTVRRGTYPDLRLTADASPSALSEAGNRRKDH